MAGAPVEMRGQPNWISFFCVAARPKAVPQCTHWLAHRHAVPAASASQLARRFWPRCNRRTTMTRILFSYAAIALSMLALDAIWLGLIARPLYAAGIGHLMAEQPNWWAAGLFYLVYAAGLLHFTVMPFDASAGWRGPLLTAAAFGFVAYATYDLSNLATLRAWPWSITLADIAWGSLASAVAAGAGRWVWLRQAAG